MHVTSQYRVDAPVEWVRSFLVAGTSDENVAVDGDVVEVRQRDRLIDLVVRNTVTANGDGGAVLDVDAHLRLRGVARLVGAVFAGRVRRTLVRSLDALPLAIERSLREGEDEEQRHGVAPSAGIEEHGADQPAHSGARGPSAGG